MNFHVRENTQQDIFGSQATIFEISSKWNKKVATYNVKLSTTFV